SRPSHLRHLGPSGAIEAVRIAAVAELAKRRDRRLLLHPRLCGVADHCLFFVQDCHVFLTCYRFRISLMVEKTENAFGYDVVLALEAAAIDGRRFAAEPCAHAFELSLRKSFALPAEAAITHDLDQEFSAVLADLRSGILHDGRRSARTLVALCFHHRALDREH